MNAYRIANLSILFLLISTILWLLGWVNFWISVPVTCLLIYGFIKLQTEIKQSYMEERPIPAWFLGCILLYSSLCVFLCGFDGRVPQSWDFIVRNPIYAHLIEHDWPMQLNNGQSVIYPIAYWLVPAGCSKLLPQFSTLLLQAWTAFGIVLIGLNIQQNLGNMRSLVLLIGMLVLAPFTLIADDILNVVFHIDAFYSVHFRLLAPITQLFNTFHFYISSLLIFSLLMKRPLTIKVRWYIAALLPVFHPMLAIIFFPYLLFSTWRATPHSSDLLKSLISPPLIGSLVTVAILGIWYMSSTGSSCCLVFEAPHSKGYSIEYLCAYITGACLNTLPLFVLWYFCRRSILLYLAGCVPVLTLFWMGQENGISEWWYKFSVLYAFSLLFTIAAAWGKRNVKFLFCILMIFSIPSFLRIIQEKEIPAAAAASFKSNPKYVVNTFSSMNDLNESLRKQFISEKTHFPLLFRYSSPSQIPHQPQTKNMIDIVPVCR